MKFSYRIQRLKNQIKEQSFIFIINNAIKSFLIMVKKPIITTNYYLSKKDKIIINTCYRGGCKTNLGDAINKELVEYLSEKKVFQYNDLLIKPNIPVYSVIGSLLDKSNVKNLVIWGSGFMKSSNDILEPPLQINLVRGKLTQKKLQNQNIDCPTSYGDPGLLLPVLYRPTPRTKKYKLGIIPHINDKKNLLVKTFLYNNKSDTVFIDIQSKPHIFVDKITACEFIISSSLHGLIFSDAYRIPNRWVKFSDLVEGGDFKFLDYYSSVGIHQMSPIKLKVNSTLSSIINQIDYDKRKLPISEIIQSCPFINDQKKNILISTFNKERG